MIIGRLVQSLRRRDWFMVVMEIGIEVSNWNQERQNRALAEYLDVPLASVDWQLVGSFPERARGLA